ncbi:MAG: ribose 5-phosphate isomerase B [Bacillota bacterium]|nr:ribose 5-phosphate isomerase B [Bacillota bacterium]
MRIALASDHAGYELKKTVIEHLNEKGAEIEDFGCFSKDRCNSIDYAPSVCKAVSGGAADIGILICGTGIGMSIIANKHKGIRAARCTDSYSARATRQHNNANVLTLGARVTGVGVALEITDTFLSTEFLGGVYAERVSKIDRLDESQK